MQGVLEFLGFVSVVVAFFYVVMYITWEIIARIVDREEDDNEE